MPVVLKKDMCRETAQQLIAQIYLYLAPSSPETGGKGNSEILPGKLDEREREGE